MYHICIIPSLLHLCGDVAGRATARAVIVEGREGTKTFGGLMLSRTKLTDRHNQAPPREREVYGQRGGLEKDDSSSKRFENIQSSVAIPHNTESRESGRPGGLNAWEREHSGRSDGKWCIHKLINYPLMAIGRSQLGEYKRGKQLLM